MNQVPLRKDTRAGGLSGRKRAQRQRMHRAGQFLGEDGVDAAMPLDARHRLEGSRDDGDPEVRLAFRPGAGMTGMTVRLINNLQRLRRERGGELGADRLGNGHGGTDVRPGRRRVNR